MKARKVELIAAFGCQAGRPGLQVGSHPIGVVQLATGPDRDLVAAPALRDDETVGSQLLKGSTNGRSADGQRDGDISLAHLLSGNDLPTHDPPPQLVIDPIGSRAVCAHKPPSCDHGDALRTQRSNVHSPRHTQDRAWHTDPAGPKLGARSLRRPGTGVTDDLAVDVGAGIANPGDLQNGLNVGIERRVFLGEELDDEAVVARSLTQVGRAGKVKESLLDDVVRAYGSNAHHARSIKFENPGVREYVEPQGPTV